MAKAVMKKLLVANRSEIACRVFQACRELGIPTVGLVVPGDEEARHVTFADEVCEVPSYLDIEAVVAVAKKAGVTLIHPGYGFLSERSEFVEAVERAGITFVGPRAETMRLMGGKITAKEVAEKALIPTLPWARVARGGDLEKEAARVGFPLLLKAAAGGGGKGMRLVFKREEFEAAAESAEAEARAAFGDGTLFLERYVERPRHIEVQVFGSGTGEGIHLFERECSLQRRHQKVWEEAPAPRLPAETRKGLLDAALRLVRETRYRSAGTLEFLVDEKGGFYFLEMNTRLQVEHPVTENITGVDLVRLQIQQALDPKGFEMPAADSLSQRGHSIEVRLYAENPAAGFAPSPGRVLELIWPTGPGIRIDSGIERGQTVGTRFDPMLAKIIVWGVDRAHALSRLRYALDETVVLGVGTNQGYLRALCDAREVIEGRMHTGYLEKDFGGGGGWPKGWIDREDLHLAALARETGATGAGLGRAGDAGGESPGHPSPWKALGGRT